MQKFLTLIFMITAHFFLSAQAIKPWSWVFSKKFNEAEILSNTKRSSVLFCKTNVPHFNQSIFSWNSHRPSNGYYSFFAQVRDAKTKQWYDWHKMYDWGTSIQQSYMNSNCNGSSYHHVRLELPQGKFADGIRIQIKGEKSDLSALRAITVNVAHLKDTIDIIPLSALAHLPSLSLENVPLQSQMVIEHPRAEHMCSPTSFSMLIGFLCKQEINPLTFALNVHDKGLDSFGSWPFNIAHAFEHCGGALYFHVARLNSFLDLYTKLQHKIPVIVSVRGPLEGAPREFKNGHLLLVVGWDNKLKKILCHDPAFETSDKVAMQYDYESFCKAWARSKNLAYIAEPSGELH